MGKFEFAKKIVRHFKRGYEVYNWIEISRSALIFNYQFFTQQTRHEIIPVLKGNAYGHGIEVVTEALINENIAYVAVDGYFEALKVHTVNKKQRVLVMGMIKPANIPRLILKNKAFVVHDVDSINAYGNLNKPIKLHLEINTGMNRYGIAKNELDAYLQLIASYPKLELEGVMSHLADADGSTEKTINEAVRIFENCVKKVKAAGFTPQYIHIGQSAGSLRIKSKAINASRIGIGFYGINPYPPKHPRYKLCQQLRPALSLKTTITEVHTLSKGDKVSYNYTYTAPKK
jgi:alanine racemase